MNLMGTCPAATHAHETKTLPKQETDADYSCKAMVCQMYQYMPSVCVTLQAWPWLLLAPDCPRTRHWSQSDEGRPCYSYYYTTHNITGQRCCSWQPFRQNCTQKSEHKFISFCITFLKILDYITHFHIFQCVIFWKITSILNSLPSIFL